jgi:hypothetical protein
MRDSAARPLLLAVLVVLLVVPATTPRDLPSESSQFDFWVGEWSVNLRMRGEDGRFADRVQAVAKIYPILDGKAILELWDSQPIKGWSLRYFDPGEGKWVLWLNWPQPGRSGLSRLDGVFRHGRGELFARRAREDGSELLSRYTFSDVARDRLRWDDAYSTDGGGTWSGNWIMEFTRVAPAPSWPGAGGDAHTFANGERCDFPQLDRFEVLAGVRSGEADGERARLVGYRALDGCAIMAFVHTAAGERYLFLTVDTSAETLDAAWLDDAPASPLERLRGRWLDDGRAELRSEGAILTWTLDGESIAYELARDGVPVETATFVGAPVR